MGLLFFKKKSLFSGSFFTKKENRMKSHKKLVVTLYLALAFFVIQFDSFAETKRPNFKDIEGHWAESEMLVAVNKNYIQGYDDLSLKPELGISRAEFIKLVERTFQLEHYPEIETSRYKDIALEGWAEPSLRKLEKMGVLKYAFPGDSLDPGKALSREEAAAIIDYTLQYKAYNKTYVGDIKPLYILEQVMIERSSLGRNFEQQNFRDITNIRGELIPSVLSLHNKGIINGVSDNLFAPKAQVSRAQAVSMILRSLNEVPEKGRVDAVEIVEENGLKYLKDMATGETLKRENFNSGIVKTGTNTYIIDFDGSLKTGFLKSGNEEFYSDAEKGLARGWRTVNGKYYYFSPVDSRLYKNGIYSTGDGVYWFGEDGAVKTGPRKGTKTADSIDWKGPSAQELENKWLEGGNQKLRFRGQEIANYAASFEGLPFKWFACDLQKGDGIYCCGTVYSAYNAFGINIPGPKDMNIKENEGYEMVRQQHDRAAEFGGVLISNDLKKLLPGDIVLQMSEMSPIEYTHVGIYLGHNNNIPYYIHATIKDGLIVQDVNYANRVWGTWFNDTFIRYNTEKNQGYDVYPKRFIN